METTTYRIKPGADDEPKDNPRDVWLEECNGGAPGWRVGGEKLYEKWFIAKLLPNGRLQRIGGISPNQTAGLDLDESGRVRLDNEDDTDTAAIADAVKAEREACAEIATDVWLTGDTHQRLGRNIAARIRARGNSDGGGA